MVVFDSARAKNGSGPIPIVYASSAAVYDEQAIPVAESAAVAPLTAYGADKVGTELHGRIAWVRHRIPNIGLRIFNAYGDRQTLRLGHADVVSILLDQLMLNQPLKIYGDGNQVRDFVHVRDVVEHLLAAMNLGNKEAQVLNVCTGRGTTIKELIDILASALGVCPAIVHAEPRDGEIQVSVGDPTMARRVLNVKAGVSLAAGAMELAEQARKRRPSRNSADHLSVSRV